MIKSRKHYEAKIKRKDEKIEMMKNETNKLIEEKKIKNQMDKVTNKATFNDAQR